MSGVTYGPNGKPEWNPPPVLTGQFETLPPTYAVLSVQQGVSVSGTPVPIALGAGHEWGEVQITVYEWELLSPEQLELVRAGTETGAASIGGLPDSSTSTGYTFTPLQPRASRMVYTETVTISSGFIPPISSLPKH